LSSDGPLKIFALSSDAGFLAAAKFPGPVAEAGDGGETGLGMEAAFSACSFSRSSSPKTPDERVWMDGAATLAYTPRLLGPRSSITVDSWRINVGTIGMANGSPDD
jgi:hypothetical protein